MKERLSNLFIKAKTVISIVADGSRSSKSGLHSHARTITTDHGWFLAIGLGTRERGDCDADTSYWRGPCHVPSLLARGRIGALSHLRSTFGVGALLVWRLPSALLLSEKSAHLWDSYCHAIPLPLLAGEQRPVFHKGSAGVS